MIRVGIRIKNKRVFIDLARKRQQIPLRVHRDVSRLMRDAIKYMQKLVPKSNLNHPHLRESFRLRNERGRITIYSTVGHALFVDTGATIPSRVARQKKVMVWEDGQDEIFSKSAKGFSFKGIGYIKKTEDWIYKNISNYVNLARYLS